MRKLDLDIEFSCVYWQIKPENFNVKLLERKVLFHINMIMLFAKPCVRTTESTCNSIKETVKSSNIEDHCLTCDADVLA